MNPDIQTVEQDMIRAGHTYLTADALRLWFSNKTGTGVFGPQFRFVASMAKDGMMEGKNNAGAHHFGRWKVDNANNTISVNWDSG